MRAEVKLCLNLNCWGTWKCVSSLSKAEVCGRILWVPPLISFIIFQSELQVSGSLPDSAWELGELNFGSLCRVILKSLEEHAANLMSRIHGAAAEKHTAGLLGLVSPAHIKCRPHFTLGSAVWVPGASIWPGSNPALWLVSLGKEIFCKSQY